MVTSNISERYLPGILIGYISERNNDANNLTKSGQITPVVDFQHIQEVLVILEVKQYVASTDDASEESTEVINDLNDAASQETSAGETETETTAAQ